MKKFYLSMLVTISVTCLSLNCDASQMVNLASGKSVEIISAGPLSFGQGKQPAVMLKYRTAVQIDDVATLRKEVDEIWDRFVVDTERAGYTQAVISATGPEKGFIITHSESYNFVFVKKDGSWRTLESLPKQQGKLDEKIVRDFVERVDWLHSNKETNAFLMYFANEWTGNLASPSGPVTLNRMQLAQAVYQSASRVKNYQHQRQILKITISPDGSSAQIDSEETEQCIVDNKVIKTSLIGTDFIEVKDGNILFTKSSSSNKESL